MSERISVQEESSDLEEFTLPSIPSSWCWATPRELASPDAYALAIGPFGSNLKVSDYQNEGVPLVFVRNIRSGQFGGTSAKFVSEKKARELVAHSVESGDLLVTKMGEPPGDAGIYSEGEPRAIITADCIKFRVNNRLGTPRFFVHAINSQIGKRQIALITKGVAQQKVSLGRFAQLRLPLPPPREQKRIVAKIEELFSDLDAGVAALKRAKANLKRYRASVLKAAVEGKLTEEWRAKHPAKEPASALLARILKERRQKREADQLAKFSAADKEPPKNWKEKYVEPTLADTKGLAELPKEWCWATTGLLCDCIVPKRDKPKSFTGDIPWITLPDLDGRIHLVASSDSMGLTEAEARLYKAKVIPSGSVIMSCIGRFGLSAVLGRDSVINQQLHAFLVPALLSARYIAYAIRTQERLMISLSTATTIAYLNQDKCNAIPIPLAPLAEQKQIVNEVDVRLSQIAVADRQIELNLLRANRLRQSILKQAFEGRLVPQDPSDEPASTLLARISKDRTTAIGNLNKTRKVSRKATS